MKIVRSFLALILGFLPAACAIHPLPEDVAGVSSYDIVRQIRCETRQAVIDSALEYLTKSQYVDFSSRNIGIYYDTHRDEIAKLDPKLFKGQVRDLLALFWTTGVAYNYVLTMTEENNIDSEINLLRLFTNGMFSANIKAGFDRSRKNTRTFTITDNFRGLIQKVPNEYCNGKLVDKNYIYPIAGHIGVDGMVHAFVYLSLFGNLTDKDNSAKGPPTLVDALEFTTMVSGGATPKVTFTPTGHALSVADASLTGNVSRKDVHQVTVGLALDKASFGQLGPTRDTLFGRLLTASGGRAEQNAANAVDQFLTQRIFSPTIVVNP